MIFSNKEIFCLFIFLHGGCLGIIPAKDCDRTFFSRSGTITPPLCDQQDNSPNSKKICHWRIVAEPEERITVNITHINIKKSTNCSLGYIEIRDGYWETSSLLGKFCGAEDLITATSSSNKILIMYFNGGLQRYQDFTVTYETTCGKELYIENNFILKSQELQQRYQRNRECFWPILVPECKKVVLEFEKFDLEHHNNCSYDHVEVIDGLTSGERSLGRFCGNQTPPVITSTSNKLLLKFFSDSSIQREGFVVRIMAEYDECATTEHGCAHECINTIGSYKCSCKSGYDLHSNGKDCQRTCGSTLFGSNDTEVITSPSFPEKYLPNKTCVWEIFAPNEDLISLEFSHFDIEGKNQTHTRKERCEKDKLEIFNKVNDSFKLGGTYCGNVLPGKIISTDNAMKIVFVTNDQVERNGFSLNYSIVPNSCDKFNGNCHYGCINTAGSRKCVCSEGYVLQSNGVDCQKGCHYEISSVSGYVQSPNYPNNYPLNQNCSWKFKTTPGHKVHIDFLDFSLESQAGCAYDDVIIRDGLSSNSNTLGKFCGGGLRINKTSTTNELSMTFKADHSNVAKGFRAKYSSVCGGLWQATTQANYIFSHELYGLSDYRNNFTCEWTIVPISGHNIMMSVQLLKIEESENCEYDFVEIFKGNISLGKFCGSNKPVEDFETNQNFTIKFKSDESNTEKGFRIMYKSVTEEKVSGIKIY